MVADGIGLYQEGSGYVKRVHIEKGISTEASLDIIKRNTIICSEDKNIKERVNPPSIAEFNEKNHVKLLPLKISNLFHYQNAII